MKTFKQYLEERKYWGMEAAGTIFVALDTRNILFLKRSGEEDSERGQWEMTIGGRKDPDDVDITATRDREAGEELGVAIDVVDTKYLEIFFDTGDDHKPFKYHVFVKSVPSEFEPTLSAEHDDFRWVDIDGELPFPLHFGAERLLKHPKAKNRFME